MATRKEQMDVLISVKQAAEIIGCTTGRVRQLLLAESLPGKKVTETSWVLRQEDAVRYARENPRNVGRPRISESA